MRSREDAFTLVELLIVILLLGVVGGVVTSALIQGFSNARATSERAHALHDIERALQTVGRELRIADPLYLAADDDFERTIGAEIVRDGLVQLHTFSIEEILEEDTTIQYLVQDIQEFSLAQVATTPISELEGTVLPRRRLVTDIDNGLDAVFTYHRRDGSLIECDPAVTSNCDDRFAEAEQIGIQLVRNLEGTTPVRAETRITIRNLRYGRR